MLYYNRKIVLIIFASSFLISSIIVPMPSIAKSLEGSSIPSQVSDGINVKLQVPSILDSDGANNLKVESSTIVGKTMTDLLGGEINGVSVCRSGETNLGDLVADALVDAAKTQIINTEYAKLPIVGFQNGGGIRNKIPAGDISLEQVINALPFANNLCVNIITPSILYQSLENGVSCIVKNEDGTIRGNDGRFPQIAGMRFSFDPTQPPSNTNADHSASGRRVLGIYLNGNSTPLNKNDNTTQIVIASNDYCLKGEDGYTMFSGSKNIYKGKMLSIILAQYIEKLTLDNGGSFSYNVDGRIGIGEALATQQTKDIIITMDGSVISTDVPPVTCNNRVLVPMRAIFEAFGADIKWSSVTKTVTATKDTTTISLSIGDRVATINNKKVDLDVPASIINGRTMVPVRLIAEALGAKVDWDSQYNTVFITTKK